MTTIKKTVIMKLIGVEFSTDDVLNDGSIFLYDGAYALKDTTVVPPNGSTLKNQAAGKILAQIGSGTRDDMNFSVINTYTSSEAKLAVSPKKGIDVIASAASTIASGHGFGLSLPKAIIDYLNKITDHHFYYSYITYIQRSAGANQTSLIVGQSASISSARLGRGTYAAEATLPSDLPASSTGLMLRSIDSTSFTGVPTTSPFGVTKWMNGRLVPFDQAGTGNTPSEVLYRLYGEDLTISGRTPQQARAADLARLESFFAEGGKFHGDTRQSPSILA